MTGELWAVIAGVGFGLFQSLNRRAVSGMDVYLATFLQLLVSALVLVVICIVSVDLSLLSRAPIEALISFALAGFIHFFTGWTFLNMSQKLIGAARTSPLIGTTPLFATVTAAITLGELPDWLSLIGIVLIVAGVYVVSTRSGPVSVTAGATPMTARSTVWRGSLFGLATAFCWALSPVFTREGLKGLPSPLLAATIGMIASVLAYGLPLLFRYRQHGRLAASADALIFKIMAGVLVGLSIWAQWTALDLTAVAVVIALTMVSVPIVILLSPLVSGKQQERVTAALWIGASLIVGGVLLLILHD